MTEKQKVQNSKTILALLLNSFLFLIKLIAGLISQSTVVISDAINSLGDIITSFFIMFAVKITNKGPDVGHPFGHNRAQPLAAYTVAIFTGMLGVEIITRGYNQIKTPIFRSFTHIAFIVLIITIFIKIFMSIYFYIEGKKYNNSAIKAISVDSRNDIAISTIALVGVYSSMIGYPKIEGIIALFMGLYLIYSAFCLGKENIDYLIGKSPNKDVLEKIDEIITHYPKIIRKKEVRAHYVGDIIHLELVIIMNGEMSVSESHDIGAKLRDEIQLLPEIGRVFIHINPEKDDYRNKFI